MFDVLIIGGGFAGVWAAAAAARLRDDSATPLSIALVAPTDDLVIRPRLYQEHPEQMRVPLERILRPVGVHRIPATCTEIDTARHSVTIADRNGKPRTIGYRRLVLATGSELHRPELPGIEHAYDVDTFTGSVALDSHLRRLPTEDGPDRFTAVVVGAGFTGVEVATELVDRLRLRASECGAEQEVRVVLLDRADVVGPDLGPGPRPVIAAALDSLGVEVRLTVTPTAISPEGVRLADGTELSARTVVWTAGIRASTLTEQVPGQRDQLGRIHVDGHLRVPEAPDVYVAGDTAAAVAEEGHLVMPSCQHAIPLGKYAGHNAAADLLGRPAAVFTPNPYATCLDLGGVGAVTTLGWERTIHTTGAVAKQRKRRINEQWIYPPVDDAAEIIRQADFKVSVRG
ncbi:NAD(P)/FAD-dependent oxidoreductase [Saccharopolyspora sp. 5N708]|uniref:NAD(P)/FAD-dependent oxidoreductase n=1 Tax=Saccharopolyspora sp. 5N708 TaxID=3457424 RepID=UPI003FD5CF23